MRWRVRIAWVALLVGTALTCGCQRGAERMPVVAVQGSVEYRGKATPGAMVVFHPRDFDPAQLGPTPLLPRARVRPDGTFSVGTYDGADGMPPGRYTVTVRWRKPSNEADEEEGGPGISRIPERYENPATSRLEVEVTGPTTLKPIQLTP